MENKEEKLQYFDVEVEAQVPAIVKYRILATSAKHAESLIKFRDPIAIDYKPNKRKNIFLKIYERVSRILLISKPLL